MFSIIFPNLFPLFGSWLGRGGCGGAWVSRAESFMMSRSCWVRSASCTAEGQAGAA